MLRSLRPGSIPSVSAPGKPLTLGTRVAGKYRVVALLGAGAGHARVALDERTHDVRRLVVLETMDTGQPSRAAIEAFVEDARVRERMHHPNVLQTYELVKHEGLPVLVTEYVEGESLATLLALAFGMPEFSLEVRLTILAYAVRGLAYIHQLGAEAARPSSLVHANVSPHDIIVGYDGSVKLAGFSGAGARQRSATAVAATRLEYLAPERLHDTLQQASDVFSAGILLWELVALQRFWNDVPDYEVRRRLLAFDVPDIARSRPPIAGELGRICSQALAPDPGRRYPSAVELAIDLERFLVDRSAVATETTLALVMKNACCALQREARQVLHRAIDNALAGGSVSAPRGSESLSEAGMWQVLTRERSMPSSTTAAWAAWALAALLIAIAAYSVRPAPDVADAKPVPLEPPSLEPPSLEPLPLEPLPLEPPSLEPPRRDGVPLEAVPVEHARRLDESPAFVTPERHDSTTTIQTLLPDPEPSHRAAPSATPKLERSEAVSERRKPSTLEPSRRARRATAPAPIEALDDPPAEPSDEPALDIRLER